MNNTTLLNENKDNIQEMLELAIENDTLFTEQARKEIKELINTLPMVSMFSESRNNRIIENTNTYLVVLDRYSFSANKYQQHILLLDNKVHKSAFEYIIKIDDTNQIIYNMINNKKENYNEING